MSDDTIDYRAAEAFLKARKASLIKLGSTLDRKFFEWCSSSGFGVMDIMALFPQGSEKKKEQLPYPCELACPTCHVWFTKNFPKMMIREIIGIYRHGPTRRRKYDEYKFECPACERKRDEERAAVRANPNAHREALEAWKKRERDDARARTPDFISKYLVPGMRWNKDIPRHELYPQLRSVRLDDDMVAEAIRSMPADAFYDTPYWAAVAAEVVTRTQRPVFGLSGDRESAPDLSDHGAFRLRAHRTGHPGNPLPLPHVRENLRFSAAGRTGHRAELTYVLPIQIFPMKPPRKAPTKSLERAVMLEASGRCPWCEDGKKLKASEVQIHHIDGDPSNTVLENLIMACRNHHGQIEGQVIPRWEVELKKMCLNNPGTLERLRLKKIEQKQEPKLKKAATKVKVTGNNSGVVAGKITNHGTMAGTIKVNTLPKGPIQVVGSLVTSVDHYGYVEYLVHRLSHYRAWRPGGQAPPDNPGVVRRIFRQDFGRLPKDLALDRFEDAVIYLMARIDNTTLGRMGRAKFSTFEAWKQKGRPKK